MVSKELLQYGLGVNTRAGRPSFEVLIEAGLETTINKQDQM